jgi:hypothetical protein
MLMTLINGDFIVVTNDFFIIIFFFSLVVTLMLPLLSAKNKAPFIGAVYEIFGRNL